MLNEEVSREALSPGVLCSSVKLETNFSKNHFCKGNLDIFILTFVDHLQEKAVSFPFSDWNVGTFKLW